jgi:hypothetical protein
MTEFFTVYFSESLNKQSNYHQCVQRPLLPDLSVDTRPCIVLRSYTEGIVSQALSQVLFN